VDIKKELDENQTVLLLMPSAEYNDVLVETMKKISGGSIVYVTLNKTNDSLEEMLKKKRINVKDTVFIDAISKTIKKTPDQAERTYFCSSPGALTEISLAVSKFLKHDFDYLIFDSLTSLLVYQKKAPVGKFVSSLINKIKQSKTKAIFYALSVKEQSALIEQAGSFVDKVIDLGNKSKKTKEENKEPGEKPEK